LASRPDPTPFISVVITVKNEERHLGRLLESLASQEPPYEIVLVDALSHDATLSIAQGFERAHPGLLRIYRKYGSRGIGRNLGVLEATGEFVAFIDGDCIADSGWLKQLRSALTTTDVAAGQTSTVGNPAYGHLERVELYQQGSDVTYPSCNLVYRRALFTQLGGFDPRFITAEDIDLNLRAVRRGVHIAYVPEAIVYHQVRENLLRFGIQAFWNGYGRKQLTEKQGSLWGNYRYRRLLAGQRSVIAWARLVAAFAGYFTRVLTGGGRRLTPTPPPTGFGPSESTDGTPNHA
jgi:glycosyltransferase involved in cell wall biosynthesis